MKAEIAHKTKLRPRPKTNIAMSEMILQVRDTFPFDEPEYFICGTKGSCQGCPKKLLEIVDTELSYWEVELANGSIPSLGEVSRLGKLCKNVRRGLVRNNLISLVQTT